MRISGGRHLSCRFCRQIRSLPTQRQPSRSVVGVRTFSDKKDGKDGSSYEEDYLYDEEGNEKIRPGGGKGR